MRQGLTFIYGEMGSGKTLMGVLDAIIAYSLGWKVYSNVKSLKVPNTYVDLWSLLDEAEHPKLGGEEKKFMLLDEVQTIADGYSPPSSPYIRKLRILFSQFRKRHIYLDYISQFATGPHFSLRHLTNTLIACDATYTFGDNEPIRIDYYWTELKRHRMGRIRHGVYSWTREMFRFLYPYYDTYEITEAPEI